MQSSVPGARGTPAAYAPVAPRVPGPLIAGVRQESMRNIINYVALTATVLVVVGCSSLKGTDCAAQGEWLFSRQLRHSTTPGGREDIVNSSTSEVYLVIRDGYLWRVGDGQVLESSPYSLQRTSKDIVVIRTREYGSGDTSGDFYYRALTVDHDTLTLYAWDQESRMFHQGGPCWEYRRIRNRE